MLSLGLNSIGGIVGSGGTSPTFSGVVSARGFAANTGSNEVALAITGTASARGIGFNQTGMTSISAPAMYWNALFNRLYINPDANGLWISQAAGSNAIILDTSGARLKFSSSGTLDYLTGSTDTVFAAGGFYVGATDNGRLIVAGDRTSPALSNLQVLPSDAEPTGPNVIGDIYVTTAGVLKICTVAGSPGTWVSVGAQV